LQKAEMKALQPSWRGGAAHVNWHRDCARIKITAESVKTIDGSIKVPDRERIRGDGARL
jgi:hypothetical protein